MTTLRLLAMLLAFVVLAGCGDVEWFPEYVRKPTTPNNFAFTNKTGVPIFSAISSNAITVAGLTAASSPISVTGSTGSNSTYSINGAAPTASSGTVANGDTVKIHHTSANALGSDALTTLIIGDVSANFISTTVAVQLPTFADRTANRGQVVSTSGTIQARDTVVHQISIANGFYSLDNVNNFTSASQSISFLAGRTIFIETTASTTPGQTVNVALTVDGVTTTWKVISQ